MYQTPGLVNANGQFPTVTTPFGLANIGYSNLNGTGSIATYVTPNVIGSNPVTSWTLPGVLPGQNPGIASVITGTNPGIPPALPGPNQVGPRSVQIRPNQMGEACGLNQFLGANINGVTLASASGLPLMNPLGINEPGANFVIPPNMPRANGFQNFASYNEPQNHEPQNWAREPEPFLPSGGWPQMCEVCSLTIASENQWIAHCKGRKHQKKLLLHNRESWEEDEGYYEQHDPIMEEEQLDEEYIVIDEVTQWRKCNLCKVAFSSWVIEEAHRTGKKHLKKLRLALQAKRQGRSVDVQPVCDLCDVVFNSMEQYHFHINGKKHLKNWLERDTRNPTNKLSAPDNGWISNTASPGQNQGIPAGLPLPNPRIPSGFPGPNAGMITMPPPTNARIPAVLSLPKAVESQNDFIGPKQNGEGNKLSEPVTKRARLNPIVGTTEVRTAAVAAPAVPEPIDEDTPGEPLKLEVEANVTRHVVQPQALPSYEEVSKLAKDKTKKAPIKKSQNTISTAQNIVVVASPSPKNNILGKDLVAKTKKVPAALVIEVVKKQPLANIAVKKGADTVNANNVEKEQLVTSNSKLPEKVTSNSKLPHKSSTKKPKDDTSKIVTEKTSNSVKITTEKKKSNSEKDGSKTKDLAVTEKTPTLLPHLAIEKKLDQAFKLYSKTTWGSTKHAEDLYSNYMKLYKDYDVAYAKYIVEFKAKKALERKEKKVQ